jgi:hypothetical protein
MHAKLKAGFERTQETSYDERMENLKDRRFIDVPGAQWENEVGDQFENKPKLEIDKTTQAVDDVVTDYLENKIDATFISKDGALDPELAETCASLRRADQQDSTAAIAKNNGFREMTAGGIGSYMLVAEYEDREIDPDHADDDEPQRIRYRPIYDADRRVFWDQDSVMSDKSDAKTCWVLHPLTMEEFKDRYPDDDPAEWPNSVHQGFFDWQPDNRVMICEVFNKEWEPDVKCFYQRPGGEEYGEEDYIDPEGLEIYYKSDLEEAPHIARDLKAMGFKKVKEKKVLRTRVRRYIMNAMRILEPVETVAGSEIPVIFLVGHHVVVDGVERIRGLVRKARDPQMIKNAMLSKLMELCAQSVAKKPLLSTEQMGDHDDVWKSDTIENHTWLPIDPITNPEGRKELVPPVAWVEPQPVPPVLSALHQQVDVDLKEITRTPGATQDVKSHVPNSALTEVLSRVDKRSSKFILSMATAERWEATVWIGMAIELYYQKGRKMKGVTSKNEAVKIQLQKPSMDENEMPKKANDLSRARFDVAVEVGPSSDSKRDAALDAGLKLLTAIGSDIPDLKQVIGYHVAKNMRGEGITDIREWADGKLLRMGVGKPSTEQAQQIQREQAAQKPPPIDQLALAQAESEKAKAGKLAKEQALTDAKTEKTKIDGMVALEKAGLDKAQAGVNNQLAIHRANLDEKEALVSAAESLSGLTSTQSPSGESGSSGSQGSS